MLALVLSAGAHAQSYCNFGLHRDSSLCTPEESALIALIEQSEEFQREGDVNSAFESLLEALHIEGEVDPSSMARARLHRTLAHTLNKAGVLKLSLEHLRLARKIYEARHYQSDISYGRILGSTAGTYANLLERDSAAFYFRKYFRNRSDHDPKGLAPPLNNIAVWWVTLGEMDSALLYLGKARNFADEAGQTGALWHSMNDNEGQAHMALGNVAAAIPLFEKNLDFYRGYKMDRYFQAHLRLVKAHAQLGQLPVALQWLEKAEVLVDSLEDRFHKEQIPLFLETGLDLYQTLGNRQKELEYTSQLLAWEREEQGLLDALNGEMTSQLYDLRLAQIEQELAVSRLNSEQEVLRQNAETQASRFNRLLWGSLAVAGISCLVLTILWMRRRNYSVKRTLELERVERELANLTLRNKELESIQLREKLGHKERDLEGMALYMTQFRESTDQLAATLKSLSSLPSEARDRELKRLMIEISNLDRVDDKMQVMQDNVDLVNREFYAKLDDRYPTLTAAERELCGLIRLGMSGKEIASLRNIAPSSVKMARYRLRKKLSLGSTDDMQGFLQQM